MKLSNFMRRNMSTTTIVTAVILASPIFGPVGVITATGYAVAVIIGIGAAAADSMKHD